MPRTCSATEPEATRTGYLRSPGERPPSAVTRPGSRRWVVSRAGGRSVIGRRTPSRLQRAVTCVGLPESQSPLLRLRPSPQQPSAPERSDREPLAP